MRLYVKTRCPWRDLRLVRIRNGIPLVGLSILPSTIARQMAELYANGAYERVCVKVSPKVVICYYRLKDFCSSTMR